MLQSRQNKLGVLKSKFYRLYKEFEIITINKLVKKFITNRGEHNPFLIGIQVVGASEEVL